MPRRQKDSVKSVNIERLKRIHEEEKQELIRFKLKRIKIVNIDDNLKRIYRIEN